MFRCHCKFRQRSLVFLSISRSVYGTYSRLVRSAVVRQKFAKSKRLLNSESLDRSCLKNFTKSKLFYVVKAGEQGNLYLLHIEGQLYQLCPLCRKQRNRITVFPSLLLSNPPHGYKLSPHYHELKITETAAGLDQKKPCEAGGSPTLANFAKWTEGNSHHKNT